MYFVNLACGLSNQQVCYLLNTLYQILYPYSTHPGLEAIKISIKLNINIQTSMITSTSMYTTGVRLQYIHMGNIHIRNKFIDDF